MSRLRGRTLSAHTVADGGRRKVKIEKVPTMSARITRGDRTWSFDPDEWVFVRYAFANWGITGEGARLILGGAMGREGTTSSVKLLERMRDGRLRAPLYAHIENGQGAASGQLFKLIKTKWKLPYVKVYDNGAVVMQGTKRIAHVIDRSNLPVPVPGLIDIPEVRAATEKLTEIFEQTVGETVSIQILMT
jgi:hypothetical protein